MHLHWYLGHEVSRPYFGNHRRRHLLLPQRARQNNGPYGLYHKGCNKPSILARLEARKHPHSSTSKSSNVFSGKPKTLDFDRVSVSVAFYTYNIAQLHTDPFSGAIAVVTAAILLGSGAQGTTQRSSESFSWQLRQPLGAPNFMMITGYFLPHYVRESRGKDLHRRLMLMLGVMGFHFVGTLCERLASGCILLILCLQCFLDFNGRR